MTAGKCGLSGAGADLWTRRRTHAPAPRAAKEQVPVLNLELHESEVDALCRKGYLDADKRNDPDAIARALYEFFERTLRANT